MAGDAAAALHAATERRHAIVLPVVGVPSMTTSPSRESLAQALPDVRRAVRLPGLGARAEVWRDPEGVPHVRAASARDAFLAQGFVHAQEPR